MKTLAVLSALVTVTLGRPGYLNGIISPFAAPLVYAAPLPISSQYHAQDELGQYSYGYSGSTSAKQEVRAFDGSVAGGYSYVDANGIVQSARYVSDPVNGFRVAATNLPVAPDASATPQDAPKPVEDTPEVAEAKAAHAAAVAEAAARAAAAPEEPEPTPARPVALAGYSLHPSAGLAYAPALPYSGVFPALSIAHLQAKAALLG